PNWIHGCNAEQSDKESHGMTDGQRLSKIERLDCCREDLKPGPVIPERKFDGFKLRAICEAASIPSERLRSIIIGIEFVYGGPVISCRGKPGNKRGDQKHRNSGAFNCDPPTQISCFEQPNSSDQNSSVLKTRYASSGSAWEFPGISRRHRPVQVP